jgi:DNA-directed RNA polymerase subunit H (RpoH/RPB5)
MEEKALQILKNMLETRKLKVDKPQVLTSPLDETRMYTIGDVLIIFSDKSRINETNLNSYIKFSNDNNYSSGTIIVSQIQCSEKIQDMVRAYINNKENPLLQIFDISRLQFDMSKSNYFLPHRLLNDKEIGLLQAKFNIVDLKKNLPWIDSQDASAKWIGSRPGNIIEITRNSESAGNCLAWRYCVAKTSDS